jgi:hypothetical protein
MLVSVVQNPRPGRSPRQPKQAMLKRPEYATELHGQCLTDHHELYFHSNAQDFKTAYTVRSAERGK